MPSEDSFENKSFAPLRSIKETIALIRHSNEAVTLAPLAQFATSCPEHDRLLLVSELKQKRS